MNRRRRKPIGAEEESCITDIELLPDGRICLFGASFPVLQLLADLNLADLQLRKRLASADSSARVTDRGVGMDFSSMTDTDR